MKKRLINGVLAGLVMYICYCSVLWVRIENYRVTDYESDRLEYKIKNEVIR